MSRAGDGNQTTIGFTTNNATTPKEEPSATTSLANDEPQQFSDYMCVDPNTQHPLRHGETVLVSSPIVIPAPPYRVDALERYRTVYPASPGSDDTRVGMFS